MPKVPFNGTYEVDLLSKSEYARMFCLFFFCFADRYSRRKCFAFTPYGMKINDLSFNSTGARYGYNGTHEQDKELNADGNYVDFGNFGYDTRVAMRRNQEPFRVKYPGLSQYAIFGGNPIYFKDPDGKDIKPQNLNEKQIFITHANKVELRSWNSPTVNCILDIAEGKNEGVINLYFLSQDVPVKGKHESVFKGNIVEEIWNKRVEKKGAPSGQTYNKIINNKYKADVILQTEFMETNFDEAYDEKEGKLGDWLLTPLGLLDELNHAISTNKSTYDGSNEKEALDHQNLFQSLLNEINDGTIKVSGTIKREIEYKLKEANENIEKINAAKSKK